MLSNEDKKYIESLKDGDFSAFDSLFKKYSESLYAFALSLTKEPYIAEEITQLVFMKVWDKRLQIKEHLSFKSFLFSITYSETISWLRKEKSEKRRVNIYSGESNQISNETSFTIEFNDLNDLANQIIDQLPEKRKEIFKLSREQGFSNREIALRLGISIKTVENQITAALKTLKAKLAGHGLDGILLYFISFH